MNLVVLDLEFNQPYTFGNGRRAIANERCPLEIIQIGAVKMTGDLEVLGFRSLMVRPRIYPRMHPHVERLTGIRQDMLKHEETFPAVYEEFLKFAGKDIVLGVWGKGDVSSLYRNIQYYGLDHNALTGEFYNIQALTSLYFGKPGSVCMALRKVAAELELDLEMDFHNALNDAIYTATIFQHVINGQVLPEAERHIVSPLFTPPAPSPARIAAAAAGGV